jgi:serine O-acetyltransferase
MYSHEDMVSDIKADFRRYAELFRPAPAVGRPTMLRVLLSSPGFFVVAAYRIRFWVKARFGASNGWLIRHSLRILLVCLNHCANCYSILVMKTLIQDWPTIGPGLYLSNRGGIILGAQRLGANCVIHHNVTIGMDTKERHPEIGDGVWIGPNSVIYGQEIGDGTVVAGETVVGKSIPGRCLVAGKPGRIVARNIDSTPYISSSDPNPGEGGTAGERVCFGGMGDTRFDSDV